MKQPPIEVHIEELVAEGYDPAAGKDLHEAIRRELQRRLWPSPARAHAGAVAEETAGAVRDAAPGRDKR